MQITRTSIRLGQLGAEAARAALAQLVPTFAIVILVAAMCLTTLLTVGKSASAQRDVISKLESAGSLDLSVTDTDDHGLITKATVDILSKASGVDRVIAFAAPVDATAASVGTGGSKIPTWVAEGNLQDAAQLVQGRWPRAGEALLSMQAQATLGFDVPLGAVDTTDGQRFAIVGSFIPRDPFDNLSTGALVAAPSRSHLTSITVVASNASRVSAVQSLTLALLAPRSPLDIAVVSSSALAGLQVGIGGDLSQYGHSLLILVLGAGAVLIGVVVLADVLLHRRDLGRRRALGAARWVVIMLVLLRTGIASVAGAFAGAATGVFLLIRSGSVPPLAFTSGVVVLSVLAANVAALIPAVVGANQDPVKVLRTA